MKLSRRGLFKAAAALPFVAAGLNAGHTHNFQPDHRFFGYSCDCGAEQPATRGVFTRDALVLIHGGRVLKPDRFGTLHGSARIGYD